jgi:hypothetical protein
MPARPAHIGPMPRPIRVAKAPDGSLAYAVPMAPQSLPPVTPRALLDAWDTARDALRAAERQHHHPAFDPLWPDAGLSRWAPPRTLVFRPSGGGEPTELAIADRDAGAWADAIDSAYGLESLHGMTLCLRLLALVEALARLPWLAPMFTVSPSGIRLDPELLAAAATMPLDGAARFDEGGLKRILSRPLSSTPNRSLPGGRPTA